MADYVAYRVAADRLMIVEEDEGTWEAHIAEHEPQSLDPIEREDWWPEDDRGERSTVLVPISCRDPAVIRRWDFDR